MSRPQPYASVVIPTHERAHTLPLAVLSFQRQTIADIEILVSGDGASPQTAEAARALAASDPRVRFLDQPKAPGAGAANRDRAVRAALSERIFWCDDDDIALPDHVERLGRALDEADIADSLLTMVSLSGAVHTLAVNNADPGWRARTAGGAAKTLYDTHAAHRRSTYLRLGAPLCANAEDGPVRSLFAAFAADPAVRWKSVPAVTALSFNGARRSGMAPAERAAELGRWLEPPTGAELLEQAGTAWLAARLANAQVRAGAPRPTGTAAFLGWDQAYAPDLGARQIQDLDLAIALASATPVDAAVMEAALPQLLERVSGLRPPFDGLAGRIAACIGEDQAEALLLRQERESGAALLLAQLLIDRGRPHEARARLLLLTPADDIDLADQQTLLCAALRGEDPVQAAQHARRALEAAPKLPQAHLLLVDCLLRGSRAQEASNALRRLEAEYPRHPMLDKLRARIQAAGGKRRSRRDEIPEPSGASAIDGRQFIPITSPFRE